MISIRQLLVVALVTLGIWLIKRLHSKLTDRRDTASPSATNYQEMVVCQRCGTHIPRSEASGNEVKGYLCSDPNCIVNKN